MDNIKNKNTFLFLCLFGLLIIGFIAVAEEKEQIIYINASSINGTGFINTSGNNTQLISEMNNGYWQGNETNSQPWNVTVYFYNVKDFDYVDISSRYFSTSSTPSPHIVELLIWCETHKDFMELKDYTNENHWYSRSYTITKADHFVMTNGTVIVKLEHDSNGNQDHRIWIDTLRLIKRHY